MIVKKAGPLRRIREYVYMPRIVKVKATPIYTNDIMKKEKEKRAHRRWVTELCKNMGMSDDMIANDVDLDASCPAGNDWMILSKSKSSESPKRC